MVRCRHKECLSEAESFCCCDPIVWMCEYHLKIHLKNSINSNHAFKLFDRDTCNGIIKTLENLTKTMIGGLKSYSEHLNSVPSSINNKSSKELSQAIANINSTQESYQKIYKIIIENPLEIDIVMQIILSSSTKLDAADLFIKRLLKNSFNPNLLYQKFNLANFKKNQIEHLISKVLIVENQIKIFLESWSNSPLKPFKISFAYPDDSKSHWDKANVLKADIEKIEENYRKFISNLSSSANMRNESDISLIFLKKVYKEFLNIKNLFNQTLAEKEINLGRLGSILNLYLKENINALAILSFDTKIKNTKETILDSVSVVGNDYLYVTGTGSSIIALPNSEVFCYTSNDWCEPFIMDSSHHIRHIHNSQSGFHEGLVYFEGNVFAFGGYENINASKSAKKYNLISNKWEILPPLPKPAVSCACIVYKQNILISGKKNGSLYQYDTKINDYSMIFKGLGKGSKVLLNLDSKIYIIVELGGIYESEKENQYKFTFIKKNDSSCSGSGQSIGIIRGDLAYYSMWNKSIGISYYSFNMKTKKIALIKELIWDIESP